MSDLLRVTSKALELIRDADQYLIVRHGGTTEQAERGSIERWRANLSSLAATVASLVIVSAVGQEPVDSKLAEKLDLAKTQIQDLHETDRYDKVNDALSQLENTVKLMVDTHGPGGGNPIGWPR